MDKTFLFVGGVFWLTTTAYVIYHFHKHYKVTFETVFFAILLGPIIALIMEDPAKEELRGQQELKEFWNRHSIPSPPPISKRKKDFKFFQK